MFAYKECIIGVLLCCLLVEIHTEYNLGLEKFVLLFPKNTVLQLTIGMSIPVILPNRTIVISPGIQNNFDLPYNLTNFQVVTYARSTNFDISRETMYEYIMGILENVGLNGEECLLRAICETSHTPFHIDEKESILERIAHFILTPSIEYTNENVINEEYDPTLDFRDKLLMAEIIGKKRKRCSKVYTGCFISILDLISSRYNF